MESVQNDIVRLRDEWQDELNSITRRLAQDGLSAHEREVVACEKDLYENLIQELEGIGQFEE